MKIPELLAPAGSFACVEAAFDHGADAVYAGLGAFNLRAHSPGFTCKELSSLVNYSHKRGKKVYAAINLMPGDELLELLGKELHILSSSETLPDAFIVSDPGVISLCKDLIPDCRLHLSTQTGTFNSRSLLFWKQQGIHRVVLPRELSISEIKRMNSENIVETEIFIHGAMCVSVSGRCLLGAYVSRRHPNLGDCPQPCRIRYRIVPMEGNDSGELSFIAEEARDGVYLLNSKDLCTLQILPQLVSSGVSAVKIEGRNKSAHYVASVVKVYREALDRIAQKGEQYCVDPIWTNELESIDHRPYTTGFYGKEQLTQEVFTSKAQAGLRLVAVIKETHEGVAVADVKNSFDTGTALNVLPVHHKQSPYEVTVSSVTDLSGNPLSRAPTNRLVKLDVADARLRPGDMLRIKV